ncbi:glycosyltransferase family 4 protein [Patescibacteria group bacterium]
MKIAFLGQKGIPATYGGVERYVEELSTRLARRGHNVLVYTRPYYSPNTEKLYKGVHIQKIPTVQAKHLDTILHTFFSTLHLLFKKVDVIYVHSVGPALLIPVIRLLKPRAKVVSVFQCRDDLHAKWGGFASMILRLGAWMACKTPHATVTSSRELQAFAKNKYRVETVQIYNGVPRAKTPGSDMIQENYGLDPDSYFLVVSRLVEHKNIHRIIEDFKKISTDKKLVIAGGSAYTNKYEEELRELASDDDRIMLLGFVSGQPLWQLYQNCYTYIHASQSEGMPFSVLEAMSYGRGIIASDIQEHREALGQYGTYFNLKNSHDLIDKLDYAIANPEIMNSYGRELRERSTQLFDWDIITDEVEILFQEIISDKVDAILSEVVTRK